MSGRDIASGVLCWVLIGVIGYGAYKAAVTPVMVPLLLPLVALLGSMAATYDVVRRWRRQAAFERQRTEPQPVFHPSTVQGLLGKPRTGNRIGDQERDIVAAALRTHFAAGRIDETELGERLGLVLNAKTLDDLADAVTDLPSEVDGR